MSSTSSYSSSGETSPEDIPRGGGTIRVYLPNKQRTVVRRLTVCETIVCVSLEMSKTQLFLHLFSVDVIFSAISVKCITPDTHLHTGGRDDLYGHHVIQSHTHIHTPFVSVIHLCFRDVSDQF